MKTIKLFLLGIFLIILSCERSAGDSSLMESKTEITSKQILSRTSSIISLYEQIVALDDTTEQLVVASALTPEEIYQLWLVKIDNYRANNKVTAAQSNFLTSLENSFSPQVFIEDSEARKSFDFNGKMVEAQNLFGENEGWYLLNRVENINHRIARVSQDTSLGDGGLGDPIRVCECIKNSECKRLTGISLNGLSWENGTCNSGGCYVRNLVVWESSNTGRCKYGS